MLAFAFIVLASWPFILIALFGILRPNRAVIWAYLISWAFLPLIEIKFPGIPAYEKFTATSLALVALILFLDGSRLLKLNPTWIDIPIIAWCFAPLFSSLSNGLGAYDGISEMFRHVVHYAIPYFVGRLYLGCVESWHDLGQAVVITSAIYAPLCLFETRMGPHLHLFIYGVLGRPNYEYVGGFGPFGWQPTVFMNSAFEVNMLMVIAALVTTWTWYTGGPRHISSVSTRSSVGLFLALVILCKKWSGLGLLCLGASIILAARQCRSRMIACSIAIIPAIYMVSFSTGAYRGEGISKSIAQYSERRAESFQFRLDNDSRLVDKAMERPYFGWGGWGRNRIYDEHGRDTSINDSAYGIHLGINGGFGLAAVTLLYMLPCLCFIFRFSPNKWTLTPTVFSVPFMTVCCLHLYDNLFNSFSTPIYPLISGGVATTSLLGIEASRLNRRRRRLYREY